MEFLIWLFLLLWFNRNSNWDIQVGCDIEILECITNLLRKRNTFINF